MVTHEELKSHWREIKDRLQHHWRELSDSQLTQFDGTPNDLIGAIQRTTGASWSEVESVLSGALRDCRSASQHVGGLVEQYGKQASGFARDGCDQIAETVKRRPLESIAIALGVGIIVSAVVMHNKRRN